jgi:superfamily II DNA or RNA helicase
MSSLEQVSATITKLGDLELRALERTFGAKAFERARSYARRDRVLSLDWDPDERVLVAEVLGHGAVYETIAYFDDREDGRLGFVEGECSCPIGYDCKHVAAIVIAAIEAQAIPGLSLVDACESESREVAAAPGLPAPVVERAPSTWEQPLRALVAGRFAPATGTPLAVELGLTAPRHPDQGQPKLMARLMRPGARGGWVNGSLDWNGLDSWHVRDGRYRDDHLALVRQLHAVYRMRDGRGSYHYGYGNQRSIELSACDSAQLWPLLREAARLGLPLIHAHPQLGEVPPVLDGELVIDVARVGAAERSVAVVLRIGERPADDLVPVRAIGAAAHGLVCAERSDVEAGQDPARWRLRLVRLATQAEPQLERMLLSGERLMIPEAELDRFAMDLCPALRRIAPVVSSDGSFEPPAVSEPALVLQARYGAGTEVEVGWAWAYEVGSSTRWTPLAYDGGLAGFRDHEAEHERLREIVLEGIGLEQLGLIDQNGRPVAGSPVALRGVAGMRLTTEVLPALAGLAELQVEVGGEPPDYRDAGETLAIGVSTGEIEGERDWFDLGISIEAEGREVPFADVFTALTLGQSWMLLDDGAYFSLEDPRLLALRKLIAEAQALTDRPGASLRISRYQADLWSELAALGVVSRQAERWQRLVAPLLELDALPGYEEPPALRAQLRPYQREGFAWLATLWDLELGGILADDMGLGKTVQALALICHARCRRAADTGSEALDVADQQEVDDARRDGPFLVVAPTSVAPNWATEASRFAPELRVEVVLDTLARSGRAIEEVAAADVVVTTYTLFRLDCDAYQQVAWGALVLDEAQYVKNCRGKTYRCARELDAPFKLAITGTPMENNLLELWALLSITAPGLFPDPQRFAEHYARPIERGGDAERLARLRRRIKPLVKRRTKELVAPELPAKQEQTLTVELHPRHRKLYDTHLQRERARVLQLLDDYDRNRVTILTSIMRLRQLSLHPRLVDSRHHAVPCAKLGALVEQLDDVVSSGHRALIFSQFTQFLAAVRERLDAEGIGYCYLDGKTRRRHQVLERFRSGEDPVFLISLKAGGVGLNLVEADYCFLLDPWWNPATEAQAIDRTHRIGQTRQVMVYRLIAQDTIEEKVRALADRKAKLFHGVIDDGDLFAGGLTADDIRSLLG